MSSSERTAWCSDMPGRTSVRFNLVGLFVIMKSMVLSRRVGVVTSCVRLLSCRRLVNSMCLVDYFGLFFNRLPFQSQSGRLKSPTMNMCGWWFPTRGRESLREGIDMLSEMFGR